MQFLTRHSTTAQVLFLLATFGAGYLEGVILKLTDSACVTWATGLLIITIWIVYPLTAARICFGSVLFVSGVVLIARYRI